MQTLAKKAQHVAEWGHYQVRIDTRGDYAKAQIRDLATGPSEESVVLMSELPRRTGEEAIEWAGAWLEDHGCKAFVDGQRRRVAEFLFFVPDGAP